jgi:arabinofuranan 3-O-arabinosyltransferase
VAQRLWLGTILFAAGCGVVFPLRTARLREAPASSPPPRSTCSAPYVLHYGARISVILLPWAGLPWLVALTQRAVRRGGWRDPAAFALVVATIGGINATALVLAGLGPLLWLACSVVVHREVSPREALAAAGRIGVLSLACSLWWMGGLAVQGGYGIDVLRYTETVETVARTSLASEVLRGLGYWFFYGGDLLGPWIEPGRSYTQELWLIAVGFAVPVAAFVSAASVRWRYRAFAVLLVVLGTFVAVGAHPYDDPVAVGGLFKDLATSSSVGLALRSTPRAVPLVVLGIALLVGAGVSALSARTARLGGRPRWAAWRWPWPACRRCGRGHDRREPGATRRRSRRTGRRRPTTSTPEATTPACWSSPAPTSRRTGGATPSTRCCPGLMDRPSVARELIPYGSPASADLLMALDGASRRACSTRPPSPRWPRLMAAGDVLLQSDLQFERLPDGPPPDPRRPSSPRPRRASASPSRFGPRSPPPPNLADPGAAPRRRAHAGHPRRHPDPAPVTVYPVADPRTIVRTEASAAPSWSRATARERRRRRRGLPRRPA